MYTMCLSVVHIVCFAVIVVSIHSEIMISLLSLTSSMRQAHICNATLSNASQT